MIGDDEVFVLHDCEYRWIDASACVISRQGQMESIRVSLTLLFHSLRLCYCDTIKAISCMSKISNFVIFH